MIIPLYYHTYVYVGLERPTEIEFNNHVRDKVATKWRDLGVQLMIPSEQLDIIKENNQDIKSCCTKMFLYWLQVDTTATWNKLIKALEDINHNALAEDIKKVILQGM